MTSPLDTAPYTLLFPKSSSHTHSHTVAVMARSRASGGGGVCSWLAALLALWSMLSLVVIVMWVTWTHRVGAGQCETQRRTLLENMEGARVVWEQETQTAERDRQLSINTQTRLQREIHNITRTNQMLTHHLHTQVVLKETLTALQTAVQQNERAVDKLTTEHTHRTVLIEELQLNLTCEHHQLESCFSLSDAARSRYTAAESQRKACEIYTNYLHTHLERCELGV